MKINKKLTPYNFSSVSNKKNQYIVVHYVGAVSTAKNNVDYYASQKLQASAHYFVDEKEIWQSVEDWNSAWHCGGGLQGSGGHKFHGICKNSNSIGIEMCVKKTSGGEWYFEPETVSNTIELVKLLMKKYNIPKSRVIRHYDVTGKICPAPYVDDAKWKAEFLNKLDGTATTVIANNTTTTTTKGGNTVNVTMSVLKKGSTGKEVKTLQRLLIALGFSCGSCGVDGSFGNATLEAVKKYQKAKGLEVDGSVGSATWTSILKNA